MPHISSKSPSVTARWSGDLRALLWLELGVQFAFVRRFAVVTLERRRPLRRLDRGELLGRRVQVVRDADLAGFRQRCGGLGEWGRDDRPDRRDPPRRRLRDRDAL